MVALSHSSSFSTPQSFGQRDGSISRFPHVGCLSLRDATGKPASYARVEGKVHPFFFSRKRSTYAMARLQGMAFLPFKMLLSHAPGRGQFL